MHVLTREEMRAADAAAISMQPGGEQVLMEAAGAALADVVRAYAAPGARVVCFAGRGNNGGDGALALAALAATHRCTLRLLHERGELSPSAAKAVDRAQACGVTITSLPDEPSSALSEADVAIEALIGTGGRLPLSAPIAHAVEALNAFDGPVIACDVPAGIDADSGEAAGTALHARATLSLGAMKCGLLFEPGRAHAGELWIAEIGFPMRLLDDHERTYRALESTTFATLVPERSALVDKYRAGNVAVVAGSTEYPGAAVLCARAAARAGAGYVTLFVPEDALASVRAHLVEVVVRPRPADDDALLATLQHASSVVLGPGLGRTPQTESLVRTLCRGLERPCVVDADGVVALAGYTDLLEGKAAVITPHAREFSRLVGTTRDRIERDHVAAAAAFGKAHPRGPVLLLKGSPSVIALDAARLHLSWVGTSALATAGSGDVLAGAIGALLARGLQPRDAAAAGAFWHGLAGRVAAHRHPGGVMAGDVCEELPTAMGLVRTHAKVSKLGSARRALPPV